jgi:hypothetical protein
MSESPKDERTLDVVFATQTAIVSHPSTGSSVSVNHGTHWPADDPIVLAYPTFFTADPRYGLSSSDPLDDEGYPVRLTRGGKAETTSAAPGEKRTRR